ncbi:MAG: hydrolase [Actinobacteria bacterium 13_2_20CM_2_71_6]|nr:MAG: hydrolase [Actinobacteria bacterium 13_2_20CM_2_71_6]
MIATDLDGTVLRSDGTVSARTREALRQAGAAGAEVVFVTARPPRYIDALGLDAGLAATAVCSNGAIVYDVGTRAVVQARALPVPVARTVAQALAAALRGVGFAVETGYEVLCEPAFTKRFAADAGTETELASLAELWRRAEPMVKLLCWSGRLDADRMLAIACAAVGAAAEVTHSGGSGLLEISAPGVTKAGTLAALCTARGIDPADVVAFGDMPNDLTILDWAGTAYAMGNAHPAVRAAVGRHTATNDADGVADILELLFATG